LSIFTFNEANNNQAFENMIQEPLIDQGFENLFEHELMYLDESNRDTLVSYTPPKENVDLSFELMFKYELKFLSIHVVDALIKMCDDDQFMRSRSGKKNRRKLRKVTKKIREDEWEDDKKLTSPISLLKRTHWNDRK